MKKLLTVLAIAGALTACSNNAENTTTGDSTNVITTDSATMTTPVIIDSTQTMDTMNHNMDSTANK